MNLAIATVLFLALSATALHCLGLWAGQTGMAADGLFALTMILVLADIIRRSDHRPRR
jgi:hypothetical protein